MFFQEADPWNREGFEGGKERSSGRGVGGYLLGYLLAPLRKKALCCLDASCSYNSQNLEACLLFQSLLPTLKLNTAVWKPWGDNFVTPGALPGSACALCELHVHGNEN